MRQSDRITFMMMDSIFLGEKRVLKLRVHEFLMYMYKITVLMDSR